MVELAGGLKKLVGRASPRAALGQKIQFVWRVPTLAALV